MPKPETSMPRPEEALEELSRTTDVFRCRRPKGQVLVYAGHLAQSLFVVLSGRVLVRSGKSNGVEAPSREVAAPFVAPALADVARPAPVTLELAEDAELLFIPLGLCVPGGRVAELLEELDLTDLSLKVED